MSLNVVVLVANMTAKPDLRRTPSGTAVTTLRVACNTRRKNATGAWYDKPNYFDVDVWGIHAENACKYLDKGSRVDIKGELDFQEWTDSNQQKRNKVVIRADHVDFGPAPNRQQPTATPEPIATQPQGIPPHTAPQPMTAHQPTSQPQPQHPADPEQPQGLPPQMQPTPMQHATRPAGQPIGAPADQDDIPF